MKTKKMYSIREFGIRGSVYSRPIFQRLVEHSRAKKIVKFLKKRGRDVIIAPVLVGA